MRLGPLVLTAALVAGLAYWFVLRSPAQQDAFMAAVSGGETEVTQAAAAPPTDESEPQASDTLRPVQVMVLPSREEDTVSRLVIRGRTEANRNVHAAAETTGVVISSPLRRGTEVEAGQLLCELSPGTRAAQLLEAEAQLERARVDFDAAARLNDRGFSSTTTRMSRAADLEAAQAAVDLVNWDIGKLKIVAPFDGILESDTAELGARLAPGETCATIIDLSIVKVTGFVGEQNIDSIRPGQSATARLINGREETGEITFISRVADQDTRTFLVEVTLQNHEGRLRDGMTTELLIDLPAIKAHFVPQTALTLDDSGELGLRVIDQDTSRFLPVTILRDEARGVWLTGLPQTADIIVVGQEFVRDGRRVKAVPISWDDLG
ncbi:MAG: efflux RND transporter periplasmic adaptor subunit [Pseudomonadota bacterium]